MRKLIALILGFSCCAAVAQAAPRLTPGSPDAASLRGEAPFLLTLSSGEQEAFEWAAPDAGRGDEDREAARIEELAYRISYAGALLLTADRLVRSFDSILESMQMNTGDGTNFRFVLEPRRRGFEVGLRLTRPIGF